MLAAVLSVNAICHSQRLHGLFESVGLHGVTSPLQGKGRVRVTSGLIGVLEINPSPSSSPLWKGRGDRRPKRFVTTRNLLLAVAPQPIKKRATLLNIPQRLHPESSTTSARPVEPMRSLDVHWRARVCWRADLASCRSTASPRTSDTSADAPNMNRSLRIPRIRADAAP